MASSSSSNINIDHHHHHHCDKQSIRDKIWHHMERTNIARHPRPVFNRIPNFANATLACDRLLQLPEFQRAKVVKCNPDTAQQHARYLCLRERKTLFVPTPRLKSGLFNQIIGPSSGQNEKDDDYDKLLRYCSTKEAITDCRYSHPITLQDTITPDLIIVGSVAVSITGGYRIGKGAGYADLEYGALQTLACHHSSSSSSMSIPRTGTIVVTIVHDCQVFDHINKSIFASHDFTVDLVLTPTKTIRCTKKIGEDSIGGGSGGIQWNLLSPERIEQMPILNELRQMIKQ